MTLIDDREEEELSYPPIIFMLDLAGNLEWSSFFITDE